MAKKVVITDYQYDDIHAEREIITGAGYELCDYQIKNHKELIHFVKDADAIITQYSDISAELIEELDHCEMIIKYGIGVNNIDCEAASKKGIYVCNVPDYGVEEVSDHAVTMILSLAKKLPVLMNSFRNDEWGYSSTVPLKRIQGSILGLIGFGRIPQLVAQKMKGFEVTVNVYDPYISGDTTQQAGVHLVDLETIFRESDFISVHVPLNNETKGLVNKHSFSMMKPEALIINTARGGVVDENDLIEALRSHVIAGAGVDVYETEPVKAGHPLLHMDQVIATPHCAWYSETAITTLQRKVAEEVVNVLGGNQPFHCVNRKELQGRAEKESQTT